AVKEAVFPFARFPGVDPVLSPEMKSTGEVMGVGKTFGEAYGKANEGGSIKLPTSGKALLSVREADKQRIKLVARDLADLGFELFATGGTCDSILSAGVDCVRVNKVMEGRPHIVDMIKNDDFDLIVNTTEGKQAMLDSASIRRAALQHKISYTTTMSGGEAIVMAIQHQGEPMVVSLQELHG
ncbi:MAG TPA: carbamoyl phosphate synthase large subunit, partial [Chromatiaceae bacterium]|nr:carbamoyl phosphate synthase large subunit [Chromatiaceae bacterium]